MIENLIDKTKKKFFEEYYQYVAYDNFVLEYHKNITVRKNELFHNDTLDNNNSYGNMVLPIPPNNKQYILLNSELLNFEKSCEHVESFVHELTHLIQYLEYAKIYCNGDYTQITDDVDWLPFYFCSEFCAKKQGLIYSYDFKVDFLNINKLTLKKEAEEIFKPYEINSFRKKHLDFANETISPIEFLYHFFRFLAQISKWEELYKTDFYNDMLSIFAKNRDLVVELINLMPKEIAINDIKRNALRIREIILSCFNINLE